MYHFFKSLYYALEGYNMLYKGIFRYRMYGTLLNILD